MLGSIIAPVVMGLFLPTTDLKIDSQKDYVRVTCADEAPLCPEKKVYINQGYSCGLSDWCNKDVLGHVDADTMKALREKAVLPWQRYQLKLYEPRKTPLLVYNSEDLREWQVDQKVWFSNEAQSVDLITYDVTLLQNNEGVRVLFDYDPDMEMNFQLEDQDLWRSETLQLGSADHFVKSTVRLRWQKQ